MGDAPARGPVELRGYAYANSLVSTDWVLERVDDASVVIVETSEDPDLYASEHVPGATELDAIRDLREPLRRDFNDVGAFAALMGRIGADPDSTIVLYGDRENRCACYAFWALTLFGHDDLRIMDGGRLKWTSEGKPTTRSVPPRPQAEYEPLTRDDASNRAFLEDVLRHGHMKKPLVDVRTPEEFGRADDSGHIPGAVNVPWSLSLDHASGTFLDATHLEEVYGTIDAQEDVVVYSGIGMRSSHTWFVLKYLLGYPNVRNYDGSWTEYANVTGVEIERE